MSKAAAEALKKARAKIATPGAWIQKSMARDDNDSVVYAHDKSAVCFCVDGALLSVNGPGGKDYVRGSSLFLSMAARAAGFETASKFNDAKDRTHAEVLALYDRAIEMAEASR